MFSKTLALFAVFAVIAPALAAPFPGNVANVDAFVTNDLNDPKVDVASAGKTRRGDVANAYIEVENVANNLKANVASAGAKRGHVADVNAVVENTADNAEVNIASPHRRGNVADATAVVDNVGNDAKVNVASPHRRGDVAGVTAVVQNTANDLDLNVLSAGHSKRGYWDACSVADITAVVQNVANDMHINILSTRGDCDVVGLTVIVQDVLNNLNVNVLSSKRSNTFSVTEIVAAIEGALSSAGQRRGFNPNTPQTDYQPIVAAALARLRGGSKRGEGNVVDVLAVVENDLNDLDVDLASA